MSNIVSNIKENSIKDIMVLDFEIIKDNESVKEGIKRIYSVKVRKSGYKTESLMVVDKYDNNSLVGVVTIFDILYHLRPSCLHQSFHGDFYGSELKLFNQFPALLDDLKSKKIHQIMSKNIIFVKSTENIIAVIDIMIKNRCRRLPVIDNSKLIGVIYFSDIYNLIFAK